MKLFGWKFWKDLETRDERIARLEAAVEGREEKCREVEEALRFKERERALQTEIRNAKRRRWKLLWKLWSYNAVFVVFFGWMVWLLDRWRESRWCSTTPLSERRSDDIAKLESVVEARERECRETEARLEHIRRTRSVQARIRTAERQRGKLLGILKEYGTRSFGLVLVVVVSVIVAIVTVVVLSC